MEIHSKKFSKSEHMTGVAVSVWTLISLCLWFGFCWGEGECVLVCGFDSSLLLSSES